MRILALLLAGGVAAATAVAEPGPSTGKTEPSPRDRRYYFEHRLLPNWTHKSDGIFFRDLRSRAIQKLLDVAADIVGEDYADKIQVRPLEDENRVLISFPEPRELALCYHVLIVREGGSFRIITLEKTEDILGTGVKGVVGEWTAEGSHRNFGPRDYSDGDSFVRELAAGLPGAPDAETSPPGPNGETRGREDAGERKL